MANPEWDNYKPKEEHQPKKGRPTDSVSAVAKDPVDGRRVRVTLYADGMIRIKIQGVKHPLALTECYLSSPQKLITFEEIE